MGNESETFKISLQLLCLTLQFLSSSDITRSWCTIEQCLKPYDVEHSRTAKQVAIWRPYVYSLECLSSRIVGCYMEWIFFFMPSNLNPYLAHVFKFFETDSKNCNKQFI